MGQQYLRPRPNFDQCLARAVFAWVQSPSRLNIRGCIIYFSCAVKPEQCFMSVHSGHHYSGLEIAVVTLV